MRINNQDTITNDKNNQFPRYNNQTITNYQFPIIKQIYYFMFGIWLLEFIWDLEIGDWLFNFNFSIYNEEISKDALASLWGIQWN
jgi:hypothetical protein